MQDGATIKLVKLAIHVLDNTNQSSEPILSDKECEISSEINDFFVAHTQNSIVDEKREAGSVQPHGRPGQNLQRQGVRTGQPFYCEFEADG
jgi:hypothetical protein